MCKDRVTAQESGISDVGDWRAAWRRWRNGLVSSAAFQRHAAANPLLRRTARKHARELFDLGAGFIYAQTASALVESGLLAALADREMGTTEAATLADLSPASARTLLRAGAALDLVEPAGEDRWALAVRGAALAGNPCALAMFAHHRLLYADLADPLAMLRAGGGRLAELWSYGAQADPEAVAAYSRLMRESQPMVADQALAAYAFRRHRRMLDIGGGEGAFAARVASAAPKLDITVFDLPTVAGLARNRMADDSRITLHPGDFRVDPIPPGYDLITLVRVLHDHDDPVAATLLAAIREALPAHGRLLIVEPMAGTPGAERSGDAYFGMYLAAMGSGRPRRPAEIEAMLRTAGFARSRLLSTPLPLIARALIAHRN